MTTPTPPDTTIPDIVLTVPEPPPTITAATVPNLDCGLTTWEHETCTTHPGLGEDPHNQLPPTGLGGDAVFVAAVLTIIGILAVLFRPHR